MEEMNNFKNCIYYLLSYVKILELYSAMNAILQTLALYKILLLVVLLLSLLFLLLYVNDSSTICGRNL